MKKTLLSLITASVLTTLLTIPVGAAEVGTLDDKKHSVETEYYIDKFGDEVIEEIST